VIEYKGRKWPSGLLYVTLLFFILAMMPIVQFATTNEWDLVMLALGIPSLVLAIGLLCWNLYAYWGAVLASVAGVAYCVYTFIIPIFYYRLFGASLVIGLAIIPCIWALWYLLKRGTRQLYMDD